MYKVRVEWIPDDPSLADAQGVMIGGFDHNFPRVRRYTDVINRFLLRITERWPQAIFDINDDIRQAQQRAHAADLPVLLPVEGVIFVARDEAMDEHTEREGPVPMPDGQSILVLWFRPRDSRDGDRAPGPDDPALHYMNLVTGSDPLENDFCWWAVEQLWDVYLESKKAR